MSEIIEMADAAGVDSSPLDLGYGGLRVVRTREPSEITDMVFEPIVCLVLQGRKTTIIGDHTYDFQKGDSVIISLDLPGCSQVVEASPQKPYVAVAIDIQLDIVRNLILEMDIQDSDGDDCDVVAKGQGGTTLCDVVYRLFQLVNQSEVERRIMAPLLVRECHFRMMQERHSVMMRKLAKPDSHASRVHRAIQKIKEDLAAPLQVGDLAHLAGMSVSSFHDHFKRVVGSTPLQYKKNLCLLRAKTLLSQGAVSISEVAFEVGYESPTQFSREYSRKFGYTPRAEMARSAQGLGKVQRLGVARKQ